MVFDNLENLKVINITIDSNYTPTIKEDILREIIALPAKLGGLSIFNPTPAAADEYKYSMSAICKHPQGSPSRKNLYRKCQIGQVQKSTKILANNTFLQWRNKGPR